MSALLILCVLLHVALVMHAARSQRNDAWLLLMLVIPALGTLTYLVRILWCAALRPVCLPAPTGRPPADPQRELHQRRAALALSDNLLNRLALALTCLKHGRYDEAAELFESLDAGECHNDPLILLGLARSRFGLGQYHAAKQSLDRLIAANPHFRSEAGHLLYARSLEALGEVHDALHEYEALTSYSHAPEAHCRHALLLTTLGRPGEAKALYQAMLYAMQRAPRHYARLHRQWITLAEREIAALTA
ncbi:MAG: tetratricopeptide repeat protein [Gammaproteobacteria bacterium]|nr:tetratricopeptide repeat protein [Gammaproteobacteria bacterium]NIM72083.1 tetratricopeptide repeat protein [Gammaproteobacteria bacterium]NIN38364.1 tetratricopeptide repeat protein [Gammaproteobacteria bacterium]NIO23810.1 tetratricopeptide repeat protein [Gammaproteobacteria bacterium]NIO64452.1 tetratricopeptide repeat protein [Gammaproteobacteria bacterium]